MKASDMARLEAQDLIELGILGDDQPQSGSSDPGGLKHDDFFFPVEKTSETAEQLALMESKMRENGLSEDEVSDTRVILVPAMLSGSSKRLESRIDVDDAINRIKRASRTIQAFINGGEQS